MLEIDTTELDRYAKYLKKQANKLQRYKQEYYAYLMTSPKIKLKGGLLRTIDAMVYMDGKENDWYKRTGRLGSSEAVNVDIVNDKLVLYMDDEWLHKNMNSPSDKTGNDPTAHDPSADVSYSERVEEGYTYDNDGKIHPETIEPRPFMKTYFDEIVEKIKNGQASPYQLIRPIIEGWK
jgi:hypothetical protein